MFSHYPGDSQESGDQGRPGTLLRTHFDLREGSGQGQRLQRPDNVLHSLWPGPITGRSLPAARRHWPRRGQRKTWPRGSHLRPSPGPARRAPIAPHLEEGGARRRGAGAGHSLRAGVAYKGRTHRPLWLEHGTVPLRQASSWGRKSVSGPPAEGRDIRATGRATAMALAPLAAPTPRGTSG